MAEPKPPIGEKPLSKSAIVLTLVAIAIIGLISLLAWYFNRESKTTKIIVKNPISNGTKDEQLGSKELKGQHFKVTIPGYLSNVINRNESKPDGTDLYLLTDPRAGHHKQLSITAESKTRQIADYTDYTIRAADARYISNNSTDRRFGKIQSFVKLDGEYERYWIFESDNVIVRFDITGSDSADSDAIYGMIMNSLTIS